MSLPKPAKMLQYALCLGVSVCAVGAIWKLLGYNSRKPTGQRNQNSMTIRECDITPKRDKSIKKIKHMSVKSKRKKNREKRRRKEIQETRFLVFETEEALPVRLDA